MQVTDNLRINARNGNNTRGELGVKLPDTESLEDYEARVKLSRMIGLKTVPKHNPNALHELAGISAKKIKLKTIDVVELVSEARSSDTQGIS